MAIPVNENGQLDAIVTWFELQLDDDIVLTSSPDAKSCWEQAVYHIQLGDFETTYLPNLHVFTGVLQLTFLFFFQIVRSSHSHQEGRRVSKSPHDFKV